MFRADHREGLGQDLIIPVGWEFDEVKQAAFDLAYPGNGQAPW